LAAVASALSSHEDRLPAEALALEAKLPDRREPRGRWPAAGRQMGGRASSRG
jgi:hypothetical protein